MKVLIACKWGDVAERDKWGHCLCRACKQHRAQYQGAHSRAAYQRMWRIEHPDKAAMYVKRWTLANEDKRRKIVASWRMRNPDKVKLMNSNGGKKWARNNKGIRNASVKARQLALKDRTPAWADLEKIRLFYIEAERLSKLTGVPHEVDHIIPVQGELVSGLHVHNNLQVIPRSLNRSKGNTVKL